MANARTPRSSDEGRIGPGIAWWARVLPAVIVRPWLWATAVRQAARTVAQGWWRRPPYLPVPDGRYLEFRLETAYGLRGTPESADVIRYLTWCRDTDRMRRRGAE